MKDLGLDSLDQVEIIMAMEDEFGKYKWSAPLCNYILKCGCRLQSQNCPALKLIVDKKKPQQPISYITQTTSFSFTD